MDLCIFVYAAFVRFIVRTTFAYTCIVIEVDATAPASAFMFNYISINKKNSHSVLSVKHISVRTVLKIFSQLGKQYLFAVTFVRTQCRVTQQNFLLSQKIM